jgi:hypothetical protein
MFRIILRCRGISPEDGPQAAIDVTEEFTHRPWQQNVKCSWTGHELILEAENDFDDAGLALQDEFSDAICACLSGGLGPITVMSVTHLL